MTGGTRMLVAMWPDWPVAAAGVASDVPAVVVASNRVVAVTAAARAEGVVTGIRRREAQGRCPRLEVVAADPGRDAREWEPVVAEVERLTTSVEVLGPGSLALVTRGPSRYFGGDVALARKVGEVVEGAVGGGRASGVGEGCRVGVADGRFAARLAARLAAPGGLVILPGESANWLAPHPIRSLGADFADLTDLLVRLGLTTLGDLAALPAPSVLERFGVEGVRAQHLALGLEEQGLEGRDPPPELTCTAIMDPPETRLEAAAFVAKSLADDMHARLAAAGLATTTVAIEVETEHGESLIRHWRHDGDLNAVALAERARWQLDGWLAGSGSGQGGPTGGMTLLRLTPLEVRPDAGRQLGFWGGTADSDVRAARAMARVQGLLGPEAVTTAVLQGGRGWAEQVRLIPWGDSRQEPDGRPAGAREVPGRGAPWPGRWPGPAPFVVYQPSRPADLCGSGGVPVEVSGRGLLSAAPVALAVDGGHSQDIVSWAGPWPLEERWWEAGGRRRARLQVVVSGGAAHVVCRERGGWWLEASYE